MGTNQGNHGFTRVLCEHGNTPEGCRACWDDFDANIPADVAASTVGPLPVDWRSTEEYEDLLAEFVDFRTSQQEVGRFQEERFERHAEIIGDLRAELRNLADGYGTRLKLAELDARIETIEARFGPIGDNDA